MKCCFYKKDSSLIISLTFIYKMNQTGYVIKSLQPLDVSLFYPGQVYKTLEDAKEALKVIYYDSSAGIYCGDFFIISKRINDEKNLLRNIVYICPIVDTINQTINSIINTAQFCEIYGEIRLN